MLIYPNIQSPSDSMAQLVPCSAYSPPSSSDFGRSDSLEVGPMYESQVPSPSLAWAGSYWSESRSPALYQPTPSPPSGQGLSSSPPPFFKQEPSSSLEELLSDFTYDETQYSNYGKFECKTQEPGNALLRQCLRSTNQQQRCHLHFLNQLGSAIAFPENGIKSVKGQQQFWSNHTTGNNNAQGLASVLTMVMEQVNEEVRSTCEILGVSPDPSKWSADDVKAWLLWTSRQCALGFIPLERFYMDGASLITLPEEEFRMRAPQGGDTLYAKLDIWRSAWQQSHGTSHQLAHEQQSPQPPQLPTIQVEEACPDMSDLLAWISSTQDVQQPGLLGNPSSQHLMVPSPASSPRTSSASPYSDHDRTLSGSEDFSSEVEEVDDEDDMDLAKDDQSNTNGSSMSQGSGSNGSHIHLWQFLKELLSQPALHGSAIRWLDRARGVFKIEDSVRVARLWGKRKNRPAMNYDKLSRSIRQYYRKGIMKKTERSQRLVYQFCHPYAL